MAAYLRVSTDDQGDSGLGLDAQRSTILAAITSRGWSVAGQYVDVASGKSLDGRPGLDAALAAVRSGVADGLIVAKLDRLSRSVANAATFIEEATRDGWLLVLVGEGIDLSTISGRAMAQMVSVFAEMERGMIGQRTAAALAALKARGARLGRPRTLPENITERVVDERRGGASLQAIAERLEQDGVPTAQGGRWHRSTVAAVLRSAALDAAARELAA